MRWSSSGWVASCLAWQENDNSFVGVVMEGDYVGVRVNRCRAQWASYSIVRLEMESLNSTGPIWEYSLLGNRVSGVVLNFVSLIGGHRDCIVLYVIISSMMQ